MPHGREVTQEFVVEVDQAAVARARSWLLGVRALSAWVGAVGGALIVGLAFVPALLIGFRLAFWQQALVVSPGLILILGAQRQFTALRRLRQVWTTSGIPSVAMRFSGEGLSCGVSAAPGFAFLPWSAVAGFHLTRRRGQRLLVLQLVPGVTATTPGVTGLDHPDLQRALHRKVLGIRGIRYPVSVLCRSLDEIDRALVYFTGGRVRIH